MKQFMMKRVPTAWLGMGSLNLYFWRLCWCLLRELRLFLVLILCVAVGRYLGVEPAAYSDEVGDYGDYDASGYAPQEPAYSDHPAYDDEPVYGDDAIDTYGAAGGNGKPYNPYDDNDDDVL